MHTISRLAMSLVVLLAAFWCLPAAPPSPAKGEYLVYIGTYTRGDSKGIYVSRFDPTTGTLSSPTLAAETANPSFLAVHPTRRFLYAVSEIDNFGGEKSGAVSSFTIDTQTGKLTFLNKVSSRGGGPCYLAVDKAGKNLLVANYGGGSVAVLPIKADGTLAEASASVQHSGSSANPRRQQGPHAHSINLSADQRFAIAADLGLDKLLVYRFDAARGSLTPNDPPSAALAPGSGPRHFAFHPRGRYGYVINEMLSTVTAFAYDPAAGIFKELQTISTLPPDFQGNNSTAEVQAHPGGKFLYGSNRGHDSISVFAIDPTKGTLTAVDQVSTQGKTPRNFGLDPTGSYLIAANQNSNNLVVFRINAQNGRLTPTGQTLEAPIPVCVKFVALD